MNFVGVVCTFQIHKILISVADPKSLDPDPDNVPNQDLEHINLHVKKN